MELLLYRYETDTTSLVGIWHSDAMLFCVQKYAQTFKEYMEVCMVKYRDFELIPPPHRGYRPSSSSMFTGGRTRIGLEWPWNLNMPFKYQINSLLSSHSSKNFEPRAVALLVTTNIYGAYGVTLCMCVQHGDCIHSSKDLWKNPIVSKKAN